MLTQRQAWCLFGIAHIQLSLTCPPPAPLSPRAARMAIAARDFDCRVDHAFLCSVRARHRTVENSARCRHDRPLVRDPGVEDFPQDGECPVRSIAVSTADVPLVSEPLSRHAHVMANDHTSR